jgi:hypothetical protein
MSSKHQADSLKIGSYHRFLQFALVHDELLSERENSDHCRPIKPYEGEQIERLCDQHHEQDRHFENMEPGNLKIQSIGTEFSRSTSL